MAIPTSYTDDELKAYMLGTLEGVGPSSAWAITAFDEQLNDVLIDYGVTAIASATDITKLRVIARVHAWRKLSRAVAGDVDFSADGGTYKQSQLHDMIADELEKAEADAAVYAVSAVDTIVIGSMQYGDTSVAQ